MQWINKDIMQKNITWTQKNFPGKKLLCTLCMIYNFTIAITRKQFAICDVQSKNSNPELIILERKLPSNIKED